MHTDRADLDDKVDPETPNQQGLQNLVSTEVASNNDEWDDFISGDNDVEIAEACTYEGIVCEVQSQRAILESGDEEEVPASAIVSTATAMGYIASLKELARSKLLGEEHMSAQDKLESAVIASALPKQTHIADFFCK